MDTFIETLIPILVPAIATVLVALLGLVAALVRSKTRSIEMRDALMLADDTVADVVLELQATEVDPRKTGPAPSEDLPGYERARGWTPEAAATVKRRAVDTVAEHLGGHTMSVLERGLGGGTKKWIGTKVEAEVARNK
jgi:hypothetical protein